jgi:Methyltransferase domain
MILKKNLPEVLAMARAASRVLDVGGWFQPLNHATHVLDLNPWQTRRNEQALDPGSLERFSETTWTQWDACKTPWPYPDKFFDVSFCSHTLEDLRDPVGVCAELVRVSKSGYLETPSRLREIFVKERFFYLKALLGRLPQIGFAQHRWFVEIDNAHVRFTAKDHMILLSRNHFITRSDLGRKLTEEESGVGLFWSGSFSCEEVLQYDDSGLGEFRTRALKQARSGARRPGV